MNFEEVFSFEHLYQSGKKACKGVRWKASTQNFECQLMANVYKYKQLLYKGTYKSKGFHEFVERERGKVRLIQSVHITERMIQKCLCDYCLLPLFKPTFIYDNAACIKGKGVGFAIRRLKAHLHRYYRENNSNEGYILLFDVKSFFNSIDHEILLNFVKAKLEDKGLYGLFEYFIRCFDGDKGLGLGSQVSQVGAAIYMNKFDHYFKDVLGIEYFGRYMDDGYIICNSKEKLQKLKQIVIEQLGLLKLKANENKTQIFRLDKGFTYLKRRFTLHSNGKLVVKPYKKNILRYKRKAKKLINKQVDIEKLIDLHQSFEGYLKEFNYFDRYTKMIKGASELCDILLNKKLSMQKMAS